jgi:DHA1 family multidrug resistance protein-like MFS transporter
MSDIFRDSPIGQLIRLASQNTLLQYPEEKPSFSCPHCYDSSYQPDESSPPPALDTIQSTGSSAGDSEKRNSNEHNEDRPAEEEVAVNLQRTQTQPYTDERLELEIRLEKERSRAIPVIAVRTADGTILVDWYATNDPENPQNWSQKKKALVALQIE